MIIVSVKTMYERKHMFEVNINSILEQAYPFDKLVVNIDNDLDETAYTFYEKLAEKDKRIELYKCERKWRSYNKLIPTLQRYPNDVIITMDDDIYYPKYCVSTLVEEHEKNPDCIVCQETHSLKYENGKLDFRCAIDVKLKQKQWGKYLSGCCLFPPHVFDGTNVFDYDEMMSLTEGTHDELWFWIHSTLKGVQCIGLNYIRSFAEEVKVPYKEGEFKLANLNINSNRQNGYMDKINAKYGKQLKEAIDKKPVLFTITPDNYYAFAFLVPHIKAYYKMPYKLEFDDKLTESYRKNLAKIILKKATI